MGLGAVLEPLVVVGLLAFGTLINRNRGETASSGSPFSSSRPPPWQHIRYTPDPDYDDPETGSGGKGDGEIVTHLPLSRTSSTSSDTLVAEDATTKAPSRWRQRKLRFMGWETEVTTPNTEIFHDRFLSRVLRRFPFLVEVWYWALIYWVCCCFTPPPQPTSSFWCRATLLTTLQVYQLGRAFTAVTLQESTVNTARKHALQIIHVEQRLGIFIEPAVQGWFLERPTLLRWTNRTYSFIHIPGTILFLAVLYHVTTARPRRRLQEENGGRPLADNWREMAMPFGPAVYEKRRRTMAMCNLLAFIVFTFWPCMPPRLLSDPDYTGPDAEEAKSYGFVDTVHGSDGDSSVWTSNRFCNQYGKLFAVAASASQPNPPPPARPRTDDDTLASSSRDAVAPLWLFLPHRAHRRRDTAEKAGPLRLAPPRHCHPGNGVPGHHPDRHRRDGEPLRFGRRGRGRGLHHRVED